MCLALMRHILFQRWRPCDPVPIAVSPEGSHEDARVHAHAHKGKSPEVTQSRGRGFGAWLQLPMASHGVSEDCVSAE